MVCCADNHDNWGYCTSADQVPEQVNIQAASPDTVVVSFVTFEGTAPPQAPFAAIQKSGSTGSPDVKRGVTHTYTTPAGNRTYYFHFVKFDGLEQSEMYDYSVKSGSEGAPWSKKYTFMSPPPERGLLPLPYLVTWAFTRGIIWAN